MTSAADRSSGSVTVLGLGAIGEPVARFLAANAVPGLRLKSVAASSRESALARAAAIHPSPDVVDLQDVAAFGDIVIECLPPHLFRQACLPVVASGRTLLPATVGGLMLNPDVADAARASGARIMVPSGALGGLDAVRALAAASAEYVELLSEKPVGGFEQSAYLTASGITLSEVGSRQCLFHGPALEGVRHFPKNANVVAALSLAGVGPERTVLSLWADPEQAVNRHTVRVRSDVGDFVATTVNIPDRNNPRTSALTPFSILSCLRNAYGTVCFA